MCEPTIHVLKSVFPRLVRQNAFANLKNGYWKKNVYIFVTELKLQVRFSMQSLHRYTLLMISSEIFQVVYPCFLFYNISDVWANTTFADMF